MQALADLLIGEAIAEQLQHFAFAIREQQRIWIAFVGGRHGSSAGVKNWAGVCGTIQPSQLRCIPPLQELTDLSNGFCVTPLQLNRRWCCQESYDSERHSLRGVDLLALH